MSGKQGKIIITAKQRHNVEIKTAPPREDDETLISFTGPSQQNKKAGAEIIGIVLSQLGEKKATNKTMKGTYACLTEKGNAGTG